MSEHALAATTETTSPTSSTVGSAFFPPDGSTNHAPANGKRLYPWVDHDHEEASQPDSPETKLDDAKDVVTMSFHWLIADVEAELSSLEADLRAEDEPSLGEKLLRAALRTALSAATSGASEHIAGLLVGEKAAALRELIKTAMESGIEEGIELGANAMRGSKEPLTAFIAGQKAAARHSYRKAQTTWLHAGRHRVRTQAQADLLEATLTPERMEQAAHFHYTASRDAWIACLAQARFGVRQSRALDENYDVVDIGPTTDLTPSETRKLRSGDHSTTDSPDEASALLGVAEGVMTVAADLPAIRAIDDTGYYGMAGRPAITHAYLNGVNEIIRAQFKGKPLSSARIPRVVICSVADGQSFTVRISETGIVFSGREAPWVRARAIAGQPWNMGQPDEVLAQIGLELLLADLVPSSSAKGISE